MSLDIDPPADRSPSRRLKRVLDGLGRRERDVARVMMRDYPVSALATVAALAEEAGASTATVLRLVQRLGYHGYGAFQEAVKAELAEMLEAPSGRFPHRLPGGGEVSFLRLAFERAAADFAGAVDPVAEADFHALVALLAERRRPVVAIGGRYSRHVAALFAEYLGVIRPAVEPAGGQPEGWSRLLIDLGPRAVVVAFDIRRHQPSVRRFCALAADRGATVALVTDVWANAESFRASLVFRLPTGSPSLMDSLTASLLFAEALVGATAQRLGQALADRLLLCEGLDCVEPGLSLAWPGIEKEGS